MIYGYMVSNIPIKYEYHLVRPIWSIDGILYSSTTLDQSGPGSNENKGVLHTPQIIGIVAALSDEI